MLVENNTILLKKVGFRYSVIQETEFFFFFFISLNAILLFIWTADGDMMASSSRHISSQVLVP